MGRPPIKSHVLLASPALPETPNSPNRRGRPTINDATQGLVVEGDPLAYGTKNSNYRSNFLPDRAGEVSKFTLLHFGWRGGEGGKKLRNAGRRVYFSSIKLYFPREIPLSREEWKSKWIDSIPSLYLVIVT